MPKQSCGDCTGDERMARTVSPSAAEYVPAGVTIEQLTKAVQGCQGAIVTGTPPRRSLARGLPRRTSRRSVSNRAIARICRQAIRRSRRQTARPRSADAGITRADVYLTNTVKHFKFEQRGKRRIHKQASLAEIAACRPWLEAEIALVRPRIIVCLGAAAARAVIGKEHSLLRQRGKFFPHPLARAVTATVHPSSILRAPDPVRRQHDYEAFVRDLRAVRRKLAHPTSLAG